MFLVDWPLIDQTNCLLGNVNMATSILISLTSVGCLVMFYFTPLFGVIYINYLGYYCVVGLHASCSPPPPQIHCILSPPRLFKGPVHPNYY